MTKTEQLDNLFDRWCLKYPDQKNKFKKDGIIYEPIYNKQQIKLLFIAKEPNDPEQNAGDFREWWGKEVKHTFSHRICEWAYGCLNNFPAYAAIPIDNQSRVDIFKCIAFMNLKKTGGGSSANHDEIKSAVENEKDFILEEISIINPDVIIGGIGFNSYWNILFDDIDFIDCGYDIKVAKWNSSKIIDYYHPSYQVPKSMSYSLLQNVFSSNIFASL